MPRTLKYRPELLDQVITQDRLASYTQVFPCASDIELAGAYLWNMQASAAIYPLICSAEVALRNSIDQALKQDLGRFWWKKGTLHYKSFYPNCQQQPFCVQALERNFSNASRQVIRDKKTRYNQYNVKPKHEEIIAKTEFSTWEHILDQEFMGPNLIWPKNMSHVFKGNWPSKKASQTLTAAKDLTKTVREFRNRIVHHEPIWKRYGVTTEIDAIDHLHDKIESITTLISLVQNLKSELLSRNKVVDRAYRVCSISELRKCQHSSSPIKINSVSKLGKVIDKMSREGAVQKVVTYKPRRKVFYIYPD
ncbi:CAAX protease [Marinobacter sp. V034]|uniref:CAAX protease n=1 Tax=Marinobacter sp. V034 TaxID=3459610 RepID=UPI004044AA63